MNSIKKIEISKFYFVSLQSLFIMELIFPGQIKKEIKISAKDIDFFLNDLDRMLKFLINELCEKKQRRERSIFKSPVKDLFARDFIRKRFHETIDDEGRKIINSFIDVLAVAIRNTSKGGKICLHHLSKFLDMCLLLKDDFKTHMFQNSYKYFSYFINEGNGNVEKMNLKTLVLNSSTIKKVEWKYESNVFLVTYFVKKCTCNIEVWENSKVTEEKDYTKIIFPLFGELFEPCLKHNLSQNFRAMKNLARDLWKNFHTDEHNISNFIKFMLLFADALFTPDGKAFVASCPSLELIGLLRILHLTRLKALKFSPDQEDSILLLQYLYKAITEWGIPERYMNLEEVLLESLYL